LRDARGRARVIRSARRRERLRGAALVRCVRTPSLSLKSRRRTRTQIFPSASTIRVHAGGLLRAVGSPQSRGGARVSNGCMLQRPDPARRRFARRGSAFLERDEPILSSAPSLRSHARGARPLPLTPSSGVRLFTNAASSSASGGRARHDPRGHG